MRQNLHRELTIFSLSILVWFAATPAEAQTPQQQVRTTAAEMHRWLGTGATGQGWRQYLKSDDLQAQLDKGAAADKHVVADVLQRYQSGANGLQMRRFAAVRRALQAWLQELSILKQDELPEAAREAKSRYVPVTDESVQRAKSQLSTAINGLDRFLATSGTNNANAWKSFLRWEDMQNALRADSPNLAVLQEVVQRYLRNENGLELPQFVAVRQRLQEFMNAAYFASNTRTQESYEALLDELAKQLESSAQDAASADTAAIGRALGWLQSGGQAPTLVTGVRRHFVKPNLHVQVSGRLLGAGVEEDVDDVGPVREYILGTDVHATARTIGRVSVELVPSANAGTFNIRLLGRAYAKSVGYNGPATIYSTSVTGIDARKPVVIDASGLRGSSAEACCITDTTTNCIAAHLRLVRRIAWNRAGQSEGQAEWIAARLAENRVERRVDSQAAGTIADAHESFLSRFRNPLLRRNAFPARLDFSTTRERLSVTVLHANDYQLGSATEPPELNAPFDLAVRVHQSIVGNYSESIIGGETLTDERLAELVKEATGDVPEELKIGPEKDPWSITFASQQPVSAVFADQELVTVTIRGRQFTRGEQAINESMEISATYKLEQTGTGSKLTRQGDVYVDYTRRGRQSIQQIAFKTFLRRKFDALFKPEVVSTGLALPGRWERAGKLRLQQLDSAQGWLALAWQLPARNERIAQAP